MYNYCTNIVHVNQETFMVMLLSAKKLYLAEITGYFSRKGGLPETASRATAAAGFQDAEIVPVLQVSDARVKLPREYQRRC